MRAKCMPKAREEWPRVLRRVVPPQRERSFPLLTKHLDFGATTIAKTYRARWEIETLLQTLKQNLKVKTFVGTTANALKIQHWFIGVPL